MTNKSHKIKLMPPSLAPWKPRKDPSRQIAVLMSGGVDSTVSAHLLKEAGWDVLGITMKIPVTCDAPPQACGRTNVASLSGELAIAHYFVDVAEAFEELIIERFRRAYAMGHTPNPCIDCNTLLKFSLVWDFVRAEFGIEHLATGHYARIRTTNGLTRLGRARDIDKDQSYFLYAIPAEKLHHLAFPLGRLTKDQVRRTAAELGLSVAQKAESMELCFAGAGDYRAALAVEQADRNGDITDMQGNKIGHHKGISNYTLGQRRGIGFAGGKPLYVGRIDAAANTIALGTRDQVCSRQIVAQSLNVLIPDELVPGKRLSAKIRSYGDPNPCSIVGLTESTVTVEFDQPQFAPCPGQRLVLYDDRSDIVAGGTITTPDR
ncbi:MAG: tRNA 2-thiouridine(34) synthase MnmA [Sedimentisphaerales bacterium]|nr:tRNA 2-thiouridine(34) synthase MnmA [Sedimentisphaerales bacterium]